MKYRSRHCQEKLYVESQALPVLTKSGPILISVGITPTLASLFYFNDMGIQKVNDCDNDRDQLFFLVMNNLCVFLIDFLLIPSCNCIFFICTMLPFK